MNMIQESITAAASFASIVWQAASSAVWPSASSTLAASPSHGVADVAELASSSPHPATAAVFAVVAAGLVVLSLGSLLCLWRVLKGPHLADRALAADALSLHVVGLVILLGIWMRTSIYMDAALVVAIIGFASTIAFAQYIGAKREPA